MHSDENGNGWIFFIFCASKKRFFMFLIRSHLLCYRYGGKLLAKSFDSPNENEIDIGIGSV